MPRPRALFAPLLLALALSASATPDPAAPAVEIPPPPKPTATAWVLMDHITGQVLAVDGGYTAV